MLKRISQIGAVVGSIALLGSIIGCGGGGGSSSPSVFTSATVSPAMLSNFQGGTVTFTGRLTDTANVTSVKATVTEPNGTQDPTPVTMLCSDGCTYQGTYTVTEPNTGTSPETYAITAVVTRTLGQPQSCTLCSFQVPGTMAPPSPPSF